MLVLSRKRDEEIVCCCGCGELLRVVVIAIRGDRVRLGLKASRGTVIHRSEIRERIEKERASHGDGDT